MNPNEKNSKNTNFFECEKCLFKSSKNSDFIRHLLTQKHENRTNPNEKNSKPKQENFDCVCGKKYKHLSSLYNHKKCSIKCLNKNAEPNEIMVNLLNQNIELQKKVIELCKDKNTIIHNTTNIQNSFNLNFFLNEQCKDALNMMDFINSLQVKLQDLEETGRIGYVNGITNIFLKGLKQLDIYKRPIHCSDLKRETLYIKDKNIWEKENEDKSKLKKAIKEVVCKNIKQIPEWQKKNPECLYSDNKKNDIYMKLVSEAMGPCKDDENERDENKIIKNIVKEVIINK